MVHFTGHKLCQNGHTCRCEWSHTSRGQSYSSQCISDGNDSQPRCNLVVRCRFRPSGSPSDVRTCTERCSYDVDASQFIAISRNSCRNERSSYTSNIFGHCATNTSRIRIQTPSPLFPLRSFSHSLCRISLFISRAVEIIDKLERLHPGK